jgi:hypothetical protein
MTTQTAYYSLKTGARVSATFGQRNPDKVETYTLDPALLKKNNIPQDADGAASNIEAARYGEQRRKIAQDIKDAKNAIRRAERAAAKPGATAAKVRKAVVNKRPAKQQIIHKSAASANPSTTYATGGAKAATKKVAKKK